MSDARTATRGAAGTEQPGGRSRTALTAGLVVTFWATFAIFVGLDTYLSMLSHHHSLARLLLYEVLVFLYWAAATPVVAVLARRFPVVPWRWNRGFLHIGTAAAFSTGFIAWFSGLIALLRPFDERGTTEFVAGFLQHFPSYFPLEMLVYAGTLGVVYAFDFYARSRERAVRAAQLERELAQARLDALASQLQPHFLFNALHTVSGLIRGDERSAAITTLAGLSDLLRYALDTHGAPEVTLGEELEAIRRYLAIQDLRYGDRLSVTLEADPETLAARIPRLLLQPLVENAVRHGSAAEAGPQWVRFRACRSNGSLRVEIENGAASGAGAKGGLGIGLRNTRARLAHLYGDAWELTARRLPDRFELAVAIPWATGPAGGASDA